MLLKFFSVFRFWRIDEKLAGRVRWPVGRRKSRLAECKSFVCALLSFNFFLEPSAWGVKCRFFHVPDGCLLKIFFFENC